MSSASPNTSVESVLKTFFGNATSHASKSISMWTRGQVTLSLGECREIPFMEIGDHLHIEDELLTMVILGVQGDLEGQLVLCFDNANGRRLASLLLGVEMTDADEWSEEEQSAVMETGNILASAYLSELTRLTSMTLLPSPPSFLQDYAGSVLQQAFMSQAMVSDDVLLCRTNFELNSEKLDWSVFFVPGPELYQTIVNDAEHFSENGGETTVCQ